MALQSKTIRTRIKSVRNTKKITKAMEIISASKLRRVVARAVNTRPYIENALAIVHTITGTDAQHPLLTAKAEGKNLMIVITSNKGLCGGYNARLIREATLVASQSAEQYDFVTIGKKGDTALRQLGLPIIASFEEKGSINAIEAGSVANFAIKQFLEGGYAKVTVAYTQYISALYQEPRVKQLVPLVDEMKTIDTQQDYLFEPKADLILNVIIDKVIRHRLYTMLLESASSEESARMLAMKNASDAAGEMIDDLSLTYNKIRQAGITQEISEISAGMTSAY